MKVALREVRPEDVPALYEHQADPVAAALIGLPSREREAHAAHWARLLADPSVVTRAIVADDALVGNVGAWHADGDAYVGYQLAPAAWGRGIGSRALALFLVEFRDRPLHATVAPHNVASARILRKLHFSIMSRAENPSDVDHYVLDA